MKPRTVLLSVGCLGVLVLLGTGLTQGQKTSHGATLPKRISIELTRDFYEALREGETGAGRIYTNDPSGEYLRQIAVSARFMVETNLQILKLQEEILRTLDAQAGHGHE